MNTLTDYIKELRRLRSLLMNVLQEKGVEVFINEKFNTLIPKIADINGGVYHRLKVKEL